MMEEGDSMRSIPIIPTEDGEQGALFAWAAYMQGRIPELKLLFAIPNGGKRHIKTAMLLKQTGVKPGVPDVLLAVPRAPFAGLFIEMKRRKNSTVSVEQKIWHTRLREAGYAVRVCRGFDEARGDILAYLEVEQ